MSQTLQPMRWILLFLIAVNAHSLPLYEVHLAGRTSYVLGTAHVQVEPTQIWPSVREKIGRARVVYIENDGERFSKDEFDSPELETDLTEGYRSGRSLKGFLNATDWLKLRRVLIENSLDPELFLVRSPKWAWKIADLAISESLKKVYVDRVFAIVEKHPDVQILVANSHVAKEGERPSTNPKVDLLIGEIASITHTPVRYLDDFLPSTFDFEPNLDNMTPANLSRYVRAKLRQLKNLEKIPDRAFVDYFKEISSEGSMLERFLKWTPDHPRLLLMLPFTSNEQLAELKPLSDNVVLRHSHWMPTIINEISQGNAFIAAGADHIVREGNFSLGSVATVLEELANVGAEIKFIGQPECGDLLSK
jgi:uncharacterized protein YbaP (TraB family)